MPDDDIYIGLDLGTSGARAIAMDASGAVVAEGKSMMADHGENRREPAVWWAAASHALHQVCEMPESSRVKAICVDGTSGTMIPIDPDGIPMDMGRMYNDMCEDADILARIARSAPGDSAAHGAASGAAKVLLFQANTKPHLVVHQADWISGQLSGVFASDDNNALKTGYDPRRACWPEWLDEVGVDRKLLPPVHEPGTATGDILPGVAASFGLPTDVKIISGTTDGCAAFLATGANKAGDGVTSLGTTLVIKLLSKEPIFAPAFGIYSHRILGLWLAGGASNTGGGVLLDHFSQAEIAALSAEMDPETDLGLDFYPLSTPGERFPISDPDLQPKLYPRPDTSADFLKAMFEGIAAIEAQAFGRLSELGGPTLRSIRTVGGGADNPSWARIRERYLKVSLCTSRNTEAAYGAACLARFAMTA